MIPPMSMNPNNERIDWHEYYEAARYRLRLAEESRSRLLAALQQIIDEDCSPQASGIARTALRKEQS